MGDSDQTSPSAAPLDSSRRHSGGLQELDDLAGPIGDLETDGKGIPILIKQYARLGGRLLSFNVDRSFSDALDGFVLIDLRRTAPGTLARYMGETESETFRRYHGLTTSTGEA